MGQVLVSPFSWGLGHATRSLPIIRELLRRKHQVTIATSGAAEALLKSEFPQCRFLHFKDYPSPDTKTSYHYLKFAAYIPVMLYAILREKQITDTIIKENHFDLIISDSRFGVYSEEIPSFFISHQFRFDVPSFLGPGRYLSEKFNACFHAKFTRVIVPDNPPGTVCLSGELARPTFPVSRKKAYYAGILSSIRKMDLPCDIDFLISVSGPGPQRLLLENIVLKQAVQLPGKKVILLGRPGENFQRQLDKDTLVYSHASREQMSRLMNRAKFIISRSGYTTVMEIAELGKKHALFIPTPGQVEQEYLSRYYKEKGWFLSRKQSLVNLAEDVVAAGRYTGFPPMSRTEENVRRLYEELFSPYLDG